jgi:hypothetical protein
MIVWTDATIPFGIFHPRIKHDVKYQVTTNGQTGTPHMLPGDYEIQWEGLRMDISRGPPTMKQEVSCPPKQSVVPGGDVEHPTEDGQQWCLIEITYNPATGQILAVEVIVCW